MNLSVILLTRGGGKAVENIVIATNGSIIPNDSLLDKIKALDIKIRISDYNITPDRTKKLINILQEREINYSLYEFAGRTGKWFNHGEVRADSYTLCDGNILAKRYKTCAFKGCLTLERGQLARCSRGSNAPRIQDFSEGKSDYFRLSDFRDKDLRRELLKYCMFPHFMEACKYCRGTNSDDMIEAAVQL